MSRAATPVSPAPAPAQTQAKPPQEKVALRAYEKWVKRGRPDGTHMQDWLEAEMEIKTEMMKIGGHAAPPRR